jgi:hypothetical protein
MVNLDQLILQHFQMLFLLLMEYIFHSPKYKMIVDYLIILYNIHLSYLLQMNDNKQHHLLNVHFEIHL